MAVVVDWAIQQCKGEESLRKATGHSVTQISVFHAHLFLSLFYLSFSRAECLQTTRQHISGVCPNWVDKRRQKGGHGAPWTANIGHRTASGTMASGYRATPCLICPVSVSWPNTADTHPCLADTYQLRRTPALIPPEKEGVPIV